MNSDLEKTLRTLVQPAQVLTDPAEMIPYEIDSALERGMPDAVVFPHAVEQVSRIVRWAYQNRVPIVGRGAGTGRSGGAVAEHGGIIVEFAQMDRLLEFDPAARQVIVEPGMVNLTLDNIVRTQGLYYPPDPSSGRVATLGGNVAENAGGPHCFKYGVTTRYITALEIVLADGQIVNLGSGAFDTPEYDFCGLVTGSEGTLALITKIQARLLCQPPDMQTMMAAFDSVRTAGNAVSALIAGGLVPATLEMMDQRVMRLVEEFSHPGLPVHAGAMLIVEVDGYSPSLSPQIQEIAHILERNGAFDVRIAHNAEERNAIWYGRKSAGGAYPHYTVDSTVPRSRIAETLDAANEICERYGLAVGHVFHAGDGNLHPSILVDASDPAQIARVMQAGGEILEQVVLRDGAISGEHGIGIEKREYMPLMFNGAELAALWDIKQVFDPLNLMNPGKIFPAKMPGYTLPTPIDGKLDDVYAPTNAEEAARILVTLSARGQPVQINRRARNALTLETHALTGIIKFAPDDLYVQLGAGTQLDKVQTFLQNQGWQLALCSPWPQSTIGGLIATNMNSPQRLLYGSVRDQLLAATVVLADGRIIRVGRPIVKNVAGYDLPKIFVGSLGTLGLLTDVTLKIVPRPRFKSTYLVSVDELEMGLALGTQLLSHSLVASAVVLCQGAQVPGLANARYVLAYTAEGMREEVEAELAQAGATIENLGGIVTQTADLTGTSLWSNLLGSVESDTLQMRLGIPPKSLSNFLSTERGALEASSFIIDVAHGLIYTTINSKSPEEMKNWVDGLRQTARTFGGYGVVTTLPEAAASTIDPWGYRPDSLDLMKRLKARWDPKGILGTQFFSGVAIQSQS